MKHFDDQTCKRLRAEFQAQLGKIKSDPVDDLACRVRQRIESQRLNTGSGTSETGQNELEMVPLNRSSRTRRSQRIIWLSATAASILVLAWVGQQIASTNNQALDATELLAAESPKEFGYIEKRKLPESQIDNQTKTQSQSRSMNVVNAGITGTMNSFQSPHQSIHALVRKMTSNSIDSAPQLVNETAESQKPKTTRYGDQQLIASLASQFLGNQK